MRFFTVTFVIMAFVISFFVAWGQPLRRDEAALYREVAATLPADVVVMAGDPPGFYYHSGRPAIVIPNEPPPGMLQAARQFGAEYLLLNENHPAPLAALYEGREDIGLELVQDFGSGFRLYRLPEAQAEGEE